jgi:hypothetical protein
MTRYDDLRRMREARFQQAKTVTENTVTKPSEIPATKSVTKPFSVTKPADVTKPPIKVEGRPKGGRPLLGDKLIRPH